MGDGSVLSKSKPDLVHPRQLYLQLYIHLTESVQVETSVNPAYTRPPRLDKMWKANHKRSLLCPLHTPYFDLLVERTKDLFVQ